MATKVKIWWTAEELRKFIPAFDSLVESYVATLPVKPKPVSEATRLKERVAELEAQLAQPKPSPKRRVKPYDITGGPTTPSE